MQKISAVTSWPSTGSSGRISWTSTGCMPCRSGSPIDNFFAHTSEYQTQQHAHIWDWMPCLRSSPHGQAPCPTPCLHQRLKWWPTMSMLTLEADVWWSTIPHPQQRPTWQPSAPCSNQSHWGLYPFRIRVDASGEGPWGWGVSVMSDWIVQCWIAFLREHCAHWAWMSWIATSMIVCTCSQSGLKTIWWLCFHTRVVMYLLEWTNYQMWGVTKYK